MSNRVREPSYRWGVPGLPAVELLLRLMAQSRRDGTICSPARQCREMEKRIPSPVRDGINAARTINPAVQIHASSTTTRTLEQSLSFDGALSVPPW